MLFYLILKVISAVENVRWHFILMVPFEHSVNIGPVCLLALFRLLVDLISADSLL